MRYALLIFLLLTSLASGQTKTVLKNLSNNALTESFVVPSGASITISPQASIINQGTATGFTTGSVSWSAITNKPTTVAEFGISDALTTTVAASTYLTSSLASSTYLTSSLASSTYQLKDEDLTSIAALTTATFGRSLLTQADATAARTALGLGTLSTQNGTLSDYLTTAVAASTYQLKDEDLTSIAALTTTTFGRSLLTQADDSAARTALGLGTLATQSGTLSDYLTTAVASSTYQPLDADLTNIAALTTTTFGRSLLTQADASAARTAIGLPLATQAEMEAGTVTATRSMSPKLVADAIAALGGTGGGSSIPLPVSIANGGTGSTTPQAARVALGVSEIIAAVAQVVVVTVQNSATAGWAGEYVDIDDGTEVCRFWFTVDGGGTAPSAPSPGRLQVVALGDGFGGGFSPADVETAFVAAFSSQSSAFSVASSAFGYFTVTNLTAGAAPGNGTSLPADFSFSTSTAGADAISRLAEADGSQLTNINAATIPNPGTLTVGGVYASSNFTGPYVIGVGGDGNLIYSTGALPIANGGTGQTTKTPAFDALAPTTTKGDLIVHNGTDNVRLAVGPTNGHVLTVDSTQANGIRWIAPSGGSGAMVLLASATASSSAAITFDNEFDSSLYSEYVLKFQGVQPATDNVALRFQLRNSTPASITDTHRNNLVFGRIDGTATIANTANLGASTGWVLGPDVGNASNELTSGSINIQPITGQWTHMTYQAYLSNQAAQRFTAVGAGACEGTTAPAGIKIYMSSGNISIGTFQLYGITK